MSLFVDQVSDAFSMADFISEAFGDRAEVVVHDVSDAESSIVYIRNGQLSGRKVGDGTTDAALKLIHEGLQSKHEYVANYGGKALGGRTFRSSTYFIKNRSGDLLGLLCVNIATTGLRDAISVLESMLSGNCNDAFDTGASSAVGTFEENLQGDPKETIRRIARSVLARFAVSPDRLSRTERIEALTQIHSEGVFLMKGAVNIVADELGVSVPTLYKYLQEIKREEQ